MQTQPILNELWLAQHKCNRKMGTWFSCHMYQSGRHKAKKNIQNKKKKTPEKYPSFSSSNSLFKTITVILTAKITSSCKTWNNNFREWQSWSKCICFEEMMKEKNSAFLQTEGVSIKTEIEKKARPCLSAFISTGGSSPREYFL